MLKTQVLLLLLLVPLATVAAELSCRVVRIVDGYTVVVLDGANAQHRIRLAGIDTPERKQPFGQKAKEHLSRLVAAQSVVVNWDKRDRYKRIVGKIIHDGRDVNLAMVQAGFAWWYRKYADEQSPADRALYEDAERKARAEGLGLWLDPDPMPPWEWRRR